MERRRKNPKAAPSEEPRCVVHDVPDDLLRLILLRLDSPLCLVRAACACKRWRRVIDGGDGGRAFLRLARSLHPPVVFGRYHNDIRGGRQFMPSSSPTPIRLSSSSLDDIFSLEFVEHPHHDDICEWHVADCHGGLVLLCDGFGVVPDLVVVDPLSQRYRDIHHPPHLIPHRPAMGRYLPRVFLLDGGDDDDDGNISISNFRVLYCSGASSRRHDSISKVYVFSTADDDDDGGGWRLVRQSTTGEFNGHVIGRIDRSLYLGKRAGSVKVLDNAGRLEFSEVNLPIRLQHGDYSTFAVVHSASPEPTASPATASSIVHVRGGHLEVFRRIPSSGEWVLEHSIPELSRAAHGLQRYPAGRCLWSAVSVIAGGTGLAVLRVPLLRGYRRSWLLSLDVDTMQLQVVPDADSYLPRLEMKPIIYTLPWPPFLTDQAT